MDWRWLVDVRGDKPRVQYLGLAVVSAIAIVVGSVLWWLFDPVVVFIVVLLSGPLLIWWDIRTRQRHPENKNE